MDKEKNSSNGWLYFLIFIVCALVASVLIILFFMQGTIKIDGAGDVDVTESIVCEGDNIDYPFFSKDGTNLSSARIIILTDRGKLDTINFVYSLEYANPDALKTGSANNHADLNSAFSEDGLSADSFDARFTNFDNKMQLTLYASAKSINGISAKYFLINGSHDLNVETLTNDYNNLGFNCIVAK